MALQELSLFADLDQGRLVQSFLSTLQSPSPRFVFGDSVPVSFRPLKSNPSNAANPWAEVDLTGKIVRIAIGNPAGTPTGGTLKLTYGGSTTAPIAYNAEASTIQSALNSLASITSDGGVVVTRPTPTGAFRIVWNNTGARTAITASTESLFPSSGAEIRVSAEGGLTAKEIVVVRLEALPAAFAELEDAMPVADIDIIEIREGSVSVGAIASLSFPVLPYGGSYTLAVGGDNTASISWDASASEIQSSLQSLASIGSGNVIVSGEFPFFTLNFDLSLGDIGAMTANLSGLIVPKGRVGFLGTNTAAMIELLNGAASVIAKLEIELYDTTEGTTWTVLQTDCTVIDDVIGNSAEVVPPFPSVLSMVTPGNSTPIDASQATITINPAGTNNTLVWYAADYGAEGNLISIEYLEPSPRADVSISVSGTEIVVSPAKSAMTVTETLTSNGSAPVIFANPMLFVTATSYIDAGDGNSIIWDGTKWVMLHSATLAEWHSSENVASPDLVGNWTPQGTATGDPLVTPTITTAAQVKTKAEATPAVMALVTLGTLGSTAGAVAAVAATNLTDGNDSTASPPFLRSFGDIGYLKTPDGWKEFPLSPLGTL